MASYRKVKKHRWMYAKPILDQIKSYGYKFDYELWGGEYCFNIKNEDCNFIITFKDLPDMKFGIWINTNYSDKKDCFFAEHIVYYDKFKPSRVAFNWDSLDEMMTFVVNSIICEEFYKTNIIAAMRDDKPDYQWFLWEDNDGEYHPEEESSWRQYIPGEHWQSWWWFEIRKATVEEIIEHFK